MKQKNLKDEGDLKTIEICRTYIELSNRLQTVNAQIKQDAVEIDKKAFHQYSLLTLNDVQQLVIVEKWMKTIENAFQMEIESVVYQLVERIQVLMGRYEKTLPEMKGEVEALAMKVDDHLRKMGFVW
jgi:type I restriction enzyme M protein